MHSESPDHAAESDGLDLEGDKNAAVEAVEYGVANDQDADDEAVLDEAAEHDKVSPPTRLSAALEERLRVAMDPMVRENARRMRESFNPLLEARASAARAALNPFIEAQAKRTRAVLNPFLEAQARQAGVTMGPSIERWARQIRESVNLAATPAWETLRRNLQSQSEQLRASLEAFARLAVLNYPPNLRNIDELSLQAVEQVVMNDGIPLYGLPRTRIAKALINAKDKAARRAILGRYAAEIAEDCEVMLGKCSAAGLQQERKFAMEALRALRDGYPAPAQALAANLLDTMVTKHFAEERKVLKPSKRVKTPEGYEDFVLRKFLAVAPIWSAYREFWVSQGDQIPREFARNATAHAVSTHQFSKRNAVQGVMLVTSLIAFLDEELTGERH